MLLERVQNMGSMVLQSVHDILVNVAEQRKALSIHAYVQTVTTRVLQMPCLFVSCYLPRVSATQVEGEDGIIFLQRLP